MPLAARAEACGQRSAPVTPTRLVLARGGRVDGCGRTRASPPLVRRGGRDFAFFFGQRLVSNSHRSRLPSSSPGRLVDSLREVAEDVGVTGAELPSGRFLGLDCLRRP